MAISSLNILKVQGYFSEKKTKVSNLMGDDNMVPNITF